MKMKMTKWSVVIILTSLLTHSSGLNAQPNNSSQQPNAPSQIRPAQDVSFVPPRLPDRGVPTGRRKGAASRGTLGFCPLTMLNLTALVPEFKTNEILELTQAESPSFWFYLPALPEEVRSAEFVLQDKQKKDVYRTKLMLPKLKKSEKGGVISIDLPSKPEQFLQSGKRYKWTFRIFCDRQERGNSDNIFVYGFVERVAKNAYNPNSIWYDLISEVGNRLRNSPENQQLRKQWEKLLREIDLDKTIQEAPFLEDYTSNSKLEPT